MSPGPALGHAGPLPLRPVQPRARALGLSAPVSPPGGPRSDTHRARRGAQQPRDTTTRGTRLVCSLLILTLGPVAPGPPWEPQRGAGLRLWARSGPHSPHCPRGAPPTHTQQENEVPEPPEGTRLSPFTRHFPHDSAEAGGQGARRQLSENQRHTRPARPLSPCPGARRGWGWREVSLTDSTLRPGLDWLPGEGSCRQPDVTSATAVPFVLAPVTS